jgi:hypothetical protein
MINDRGVYILVSPSVKEGRREEYRVAHLDSTNNITWELDQDISANALDPTKVKPYFDKVIVYSDPLEAKDEATRIINNLCVTDLPIYHIYTSTPYVAWSLPYAKENQN